MDNFTSLPHCLYNFGTIPAKLSLGAMSAIDRTIFKLPLPQVLFHRPFIGGVSVVVPQCYQQNMFMQILYFQLILSQYKYSCYKKLGLRLAHTNCECLELYALTCLYNLLALVKF